MSNLAWSGGKWAGGCFGFPERRLAIWSGKQRVNELLSPQEGDEPMECRCTSQTSTGNWWEHTARRGPQRNAHKERAICFHDWSWSVSKAVIISAIISPIRAQDCCCHVVEPSQTGNREKIHKQMLKKHPNYLWEDRQNNTIQREATQVHIFFPSLCIIIVIGYAVSVYSAMSTFLLF